MALIQWTRDLSVGVDTLDDDHKQIIALLNQLDDAIKAGHPQDVVKVVLDSLLDYTGYHFKREEALMEASGYPDIDAHIRTHQMLRSQVADIRDRYERDAESIHEREVLAFLKNWLTAHIMGRDKLYGPFMASKRDQVDEANRIFAEK